MSGRALLVALVLAALAVGAWIAVRARPAASDGRVVRQPLFAVDEIPVEQVDRLELERPGAPMLAFVRSADGWSQSAPFAHPADAAAIRMVIDAFASLESTRAVDPSSLDPEARVALGMDPARARVTVAWPGGSRTVVLGHLLRGGSPTSFDRLLGLRFGAAAVRALADGLDGQMVCLTGDSVDHVPLAQVSGRQKKVPLGCDTMRTAREMGISFGDTPATDS